MLENSGIDFEKFKEKGIPHDEFSEFFMASGLICNPNISWIVFHGSFDFGYFINLVSG